MTKNIGANTTVKNAKKKSTVRHTRAIQRDRSKRTVSMPPDEVIAERITELVHPATLAQVDHFHQLGLRERILTLPVMMAMVLSMIWRQIGSVRELTRVVQEESLLWAEPQPQLTEKAMNARLRSLPAELFWRVLFVLLPLLQKRWAERERPLTPELAWARARYTEVNACDGSTLDALLRKVGLLKETDATPLAGRMLVSRNRTIVVAWHGAVEDKYLTYAVPDHPEYRRYPLQDLVVIHPELSA